MNPVRQIRMLKEQGRKIVACFPLYPPLALLHSMGLVPVIFWGLKRDVSRTDAADRHLPSYTCSVARQMSQFFISDARDFIDGVFSYNACDTLRNLPEIIAVELAAAGRDVPFFHIHLPMSNQGKAGGSVFLENEIRTLVRDLSERFGTGFSPERFRASVALYQRMRQMTLDAESLVAEGRLGFSGFAEVMRSGAFMPVEYHLQALEKLMESCKGGPSNQKPKADDRAGVMISGILPPPVSVIVAIESAGLSIVANDIASLYRSYAVMPEPSPDPEGYYRDFYEGHYPCPTLLYTGDRRVDAFVARAVEKNARAVIFVGEKFCEYEYFEFPFLKKKLVEKGISTLEIEISMEDSRHNGANDSRIRAFAEMIRQ